MILNMIFDFWHHHDKELVGIDIGSKNIKAVELKAEKEDKFALINYAIATLEGINVRTITIEEIAEILKSILKKADIETKQVAMSLPAYSTFLSLIKVPEMSDQELDASIHYEAKKYIPTPLPETTLGWSRSNGEVLLIAVPKALAKRYAQIAKLAGLELKSLEAETFSLARALASREKGLVILIDQGAYSTNISLIKDGNIRSNRTADKSADIQPIIKNLLSSKINKIILTGGEVKEIKENIPVINGDPWVNVEYTKELGPRLKELSPILGVAIGLAKRQDAKN